MMLDDHPFFAKLEPRHLYLIADCAEFKRYEPGQYVFREGEDANQYYIIYEGEVSLERAIPGDDSVPVQVLGEGDILGWSWLIPPYSWHFNARVTAPTQLIGIDGEFLRKLCERDHELGYLLLQKVVLMMEQRLEAACERLEKREIHGSAL
jgi:CRP-like cAMP-binding protein